MHGGNYKGLLTLFPGTRAQYSYLPISLLDCVNIVLDPNMLVGGSNLDYFNTQATNSHNAPFLILVCTNRGS